MWLVWITRTRARARARARGSGSGLGLGARARGSGSSSGWWVVSVPWTCLGHALDILMHRKLDPRARARARVRALALGCVHASDMPWTCPGQSGACGS